MKDRSNCFQYSSWEILCFIILNILEICVYMVDVVDLESDCITCDFLSEGISEVNDILSRIEVVVDMFVCISFETVTISAVTSFVLPCLLDILYIVSSIFVWCNNFNNIRLGCLIHNGLSKRERYFIVFLIRIRQQ